MRRLATTLLLIMILICKVTSWADDVSMVTTEELSSMLGRSDLLIIDVRTPYDWKKSDAKIKGALREDPMKFTTWMDKYPRDKTIVLYCA